MYHVTQLIPIFARSQQVRLFCHINNYIVLWRHSFNYILFFLHVLDFFVWTSLPLENVKSLLQCVTCQWKLQMYFANICANQLSVIYKILNKLLIPHSYPDSLLPLRQTYSWNFLSKLWTIPFCLEEGLPLQHIQCPLLVLPLEDIYCFSLLTSMVSNLLSLTKW